MSNNVLLDPGVSPYEINQVQNDESS